MAKVLGGIELMDKLFEPKLRDRAIELICSNLIIAGVLLPNEVAGYMSALHRDYDNAMLGMSLVESSRLLHMSLEMTACRNKN